MKGYWSLWGAAGSKLSGLRVLLFGLRESRGPISNNPEYKL